MWVDSKLLNLRALGKLVALGQFFSMSEAPVLEHMKNKKE